MPKTGKTIPQVVGEIYELLESFAADERARILSSVGALFGGAAPAGNAGAGTGGAGLGTPASGTATASGGSGAGSQSDLAGDGARAYFDRKDPKSKSEEFATAARFLEITNPNGPGPVTKDQLQRVISTEGRRSFHQGNFGRDMGNAQRAKLFNLGGGAATGYTLSHVGQKYVDALPDRETARAIRKAATSVKKKGRGRKARHRAG